MSGGLARLAHVAALVTGAQIGAAMVASHVALEAVGPLALALCRYALATLCLLPAYVAARRVPIARADRLPLLLLGIAQFAGLIALLNVGLSFVSPDRVAVAFGTLPIVTMLVAAFMGRERLSVRLVLAAVIAVSGIGFAFSGGFAATGELGPELVGTGCVLAATLVGAVCSVHFGGYLARYPTVQIGTLAMGVAALALLPGAAVEWLAGSGRVPASAEAAAIGFVGVSSAAGFLMWLFALKHSSAGMTTLLASGSPIVAALLSTWLLDLPPRDGVLLGFALVMAGLLLGLSGRSPAVRGVSR